MLRPPDAGDRERWFELYHDPDELRYGMPAFVPVPDLDADLDDRGSRSPRGTSPPASPGDAASSPRRRPRTVPRPMAWRQELPPCCRVADVGYAVHPDARGRGVAQPGAAAARALAAPPTRAARARRGSSSTTASRTSPPAGPPWPPASSRRAYAAPSCRCATRRPRTACAATTSACTARLGPTLPTRWPSPGAVHGRSPDAPTHVITPTHAGAAWSHAHRTRDRAVRPQRRPGRPRDPRGRRPADRRRPRRRRLRRRSRARPPSAAPGCSGPAG